jgi:PAS domain S-box-containing protein
MAWRRQPSGSARFEALLESAPDAIVLAGADGRIALINRRVEELFGYTRAELLGEDIELLVPERLREAHREHRAHYLAAPRTRDMGAGLELHGRRRDGTEFPIEVSLSPLADSGATRVITVIRDVTERRRAEDARHELEKVQAARAELSGLLRDLDAILWEAASPRRDVLTFVSGRVEEILGYPLERWLEPGFWGSILHPDDRELVSPRSEAPLTPGERHELEYRLEARDGRTVRVRDSMRVVLPEEGGQTVRLRGVITDITEHRELEARLLQSQKMEAVGQLAGGIAHDFNNLLTVIAGYADRLLDRAEDDTTRLEVRQIREASDRATSLIGQLLAFSRRAPERVELVDPNSLVRELEGMIARLIGEEITITVRTSPGLDVVKVDRRQLEQVVLNLVVNARDAMPNGGEIRIETAPVEIDEDTARERGVAAGPYVMLIVSDTGTGMSEETLGRAFEPFFTTKPQGKGTGLGLSTAYGIIEAVGGYITIESELGRGTDVAVRLPSVAMHSEAADDSSAGPGSLATILLVEDESAVRGLARVILEEAGYEVVEARGGQEALALVARLGSRIDLLLTDVVMPEVGGPEIAARLRGRRPDLRVVFMSGYADSALYRRGLAESDAVMLRKPFTPETLVGKVQEALDAT